MAIRDGDWELVDYNHHTGKSTWVMYDGEKTHYRMDYPVDNLIKENKMHQNALYGQKWGEGQRVASIPLNVYFEKLAEASIQKDDKYISKWLNDSDNSAFRVKEGRV